MGLFDFFKKKKEDNYDPTNIGVSDIRKGFFVDYDMTTWEVKKAYTYDWGDHYFTKEFLISDTQSEKFLCIDDNDSLSISLHKSVKIRHIDEDLPNYILSHDTPPNKLVYEGITYYLDEDTAGYCHEEGKPEDAWSELINWDYCDKSEKHVISITQWGEREFEASVGVKVQEFEFSNITPA